MHEAEVGSTDCFSCLVRSFSDEYFCLLARVGSYDYLRHLVRVGTNEYLLCLVPVGSDKFCHILSSSLLSTIFSFVSFTLGTLEEVLLGYHCFIFLLVDGISASLLDYFLCSLF